jgi:Zn-dependent protease
MEPWFLLLIAFFAFTTVNARAHGAIALVENLLVWGPTLFLGVLLHEFGHAAAIKFFGFGPSRIILQGFGGVTINERRGNSAPAPSIWISLAGPAASLALAGVSLALLYGYSMFVLGQPPTADISNYGLVGRLLSVMSIINVIWAVFNLLPINPLDGGHVVLHALRMKYPRRQAMYYSALSSLIAIGLLGVFVLFVTPNALLVILFAGIFAFQNWQILQATKSGAQPRGPGRF